MTIRKTTALILGMLLGIAVSVVIVFVAPRPLVVVRLRDDFSVRTVMKDDAREPIPTEESNVVFFPVAKEEVHPDPEPEPVVPDREMPQWHPDPREIPRTRAGVYDKFPSKR
jgi:hypothetical protein